MGDAALCSHTMYRSRNSASHVVYDFEHYGCTSYHSRLECCPISWYGECERYPFLIPQNNTMNGRKYRRNEVDFKFDLAFIADMGRDRTERTQHLTCLEVAKWL